MGSAKFWHSVMTNVTILSPVLANGSISNLFHGDMRWLCMTAISCHHPSSLVVPGSLKLAKPLRQEGVLRSNWLCHLRRFAKCGHRTRRCSDSLCFGTTVSDPNSLFVKTIILNV